MTPAHASLICISSMTTDHAVIMVKFASDCLTKMKLLVATLAETMGQDTADLAMRGKSFWYKDGMPRT